MAATLDDLLAALAEINKNVKKGGGGNSGSGPTFSSTRLISDDEITQFKEMQSIKKEINEDSEEYFRILKKIKSVNKEIRRLNKEQLSIEEQQKNAELKKIELWNEFRMASRADRVEILKKLKLNREEIKLLIEKKKLLGENIEHLTQEAKILGKTVKEARSFKIFMHSAGKDVMSIKSGIESVYGFLMRNDAFKFQKAIRVSALQMGLVGERSEELNQRIQSIASNTVDFGYDIQKIAELQSNYSDELGRAVILGKDAGIQLAAMAAATGLGEQGAGQLAASLDSVGFSAQKTAEYIEQVVNDSSSMGLNSTKVVKNISSNIKLLNKYNFKGGTKGLQKMAETTTKMGVSMEMVSGMAEKLFDIEGAVEMSAQLQVMGGEWAKLGDPFKLMYMARNDMEGLTESVINATKASATFNTKTGEFDISALELQRLRKVAEATGLNYEELAQSAKKAAQFTEIDSQISVRYDNDEMKEFIQNTAILDKNKKATILLNGSPKLLSQLTDADKQTIKSMMGEKKTLAERAKDAQSFDEKITNLLNQMKQLLVPLVDALDKGLSPVLKKVSDTLRKPETFEAIKKFADTMGNLIGTIGKFMVDHPAWTLGLFAAFEVGKWYANGLALGAGFNSVAGAGMGRGGGGLFNSRNPADMANMSTAGKIGANFKSGLKSFGAIGGGLLAAGISGYGEYNEQLEKGKTEGQAIGRAALKGAGAGLGAWGGAAAGAAIGSVVPVVGTLIGGLIGGALGAWGGGKIADLDTYGVNDGVIFNPKDKFMKVNDGTMIAGTNENGNKELAKAINNNSILNGYAPLLKNKEVFERRETNNTTIQTSAPGTTNVNFDELKLGGRVELALGGNMTAELGRQLLQNPSFVRDISKLVNMATRTAIEGKAK